MNGFKLFLIILLIFFMCILISEVLNITCFIRDSFNRNVRNSQSEENNQDVNKKPCKENMDCGPAFICVDGFCEVSSKRDAYIKKKNLEGEENQGVKEEPPQEKKDDLPKEGFFFNKDGKKEQLKLISKENVGAYVYYKNIMIINFTDNTLEFVNTKTRTSTLFPVNLTVENMISTSEFVFGTLKNDLYVLKDTEKGYVWENVEPLENIYDITSFKDKIYVKTDKDYNLYKIYQVEKDGKVKFESSTTFFQGIVRFTEGIYALTDIENKKVVLVSNDGERQVIDNVFGGDFDENNRFIAYKEDNVRYVGDGVYYVKF